MKLKSNDETKGMTDKEYQYYMDVINEETERVDYSARFEKNKEESKELESYTFTEYRDKSGLLGKLHSKEPINQNAMTGWVIIVICLIFFFIWSERGVRAIRELNTDSVVVKGVVIDTEKKSEVVRTGRSSRLETYYYITYQWEGDNGIINENTRKTKDVAHPLVGEEIGVTVHADNHNIEINSDEQNKKTAPEDFLMSAIFIVIGIIAYVRYIKVD